MPFFLSSSPSKRKQKKKIALFWKEFQNIPFLYYSWYVWQIFHESLILGIIYEPSTTNRNPVFSFSAYIPPSHNYKAHTCIRECSFFLLLPLCLIIFAKMWSTTIHNERIILFLGYNDPLYDMNSGRQCIKKRLSGNSTQEENKFLVVGVKNSS